MSMFVRARNLPGDGSRDSNTDQLVVLQIRRVALTPEVQYKTEYSNNNTVFKLYFAVKSFSNSVRVC